MSVTPEIVLLAHGSPDRRHRAGVEVLAEHVRERAPGRVVRTAYLDHHAPTPLEVAALLTGPAVVVPVLVTPAYHAAVDIPEAVAEMEARSGLPVDSAPPLGPHALLLDAVEELLAESGIAPHPRTSVILYAAGSSDSAAVATIGETLREAPRLGWGPWVVAALDGGATVEQVLRSLPDEVERTVAVSFMVAEGVLRDRMAQRCGQARVTMVPGALSRTEAMARLVLERADSLEPAGSLPA
jgi:sirohydrochlorin ferrochelatase